MEHKPTFRAIHNFKIFNNSEQNALLIIFGKARILENICILQIILKFVSTIIFLNVESKDHFKFPPFLPTNVWHLSDKFNCKYNIMLILEFSNLTSRYILKYHSKIYFNSTCFVTKLCKCLKSIINSNLWNISNSWNVQKLVLNPHFKFALKNVTCSKMKSLIIKNWNLFNPISAGVLENQDMLGGSIWPPPL